VAKYYLIVAAFLCNYPAIFYGNQTSFYILMLMSCL